MNLKEEVGAGWWTTKQPIQPLHSPNLGADGHQREEKHDRNKPHESNLARASQDAHNYRSIEPTTPGRGLLCLYSGVKEL